MQFTIPSITLMLAIVASAQLITSPSPSSTTPTSASSTPTKVASIPFFAASSISTPATSSTSATAASSSAALNPKDYDCVYRGLGCNWVKSEYGYGADYCGSSPFKAGQQLSDGSKILAVSKDGSGDCASQAGEKCCKNLAEHPCKRGEKYLECLKP